MDAVRLLPLLLAWSAGLILPASLAQVCLNEAGQEVDWFVVYKLPKLHSMPHGLRWPYSHYRTDNQTWLSQGLAYLYMDSSSSLLMSDRSIGDPQSLVGRTLAPIYQHADANADFHLLYNDEHPDGKTSMVHGHTKGAVYFRADRGFWLVHSVPKFPPSSESTYSYPHNGLVYGQTMLCISLRTTSAADGLGQQMLFNRPYIYSSNVPPFVQSSYPLLTLVTSGLHWKAPSPYSHVLPLFTYGRRQKLVSFAKSARFGQDLYADLVAPSLRVPLHVETWPNGVGRMNSSCQGHFHVENVKAVEFDFLKPAVGFTRNHDHAKWAVSADPQYPFLCVGDINRMLEQEKRGGGTVCLEHSAAWQAFSTAVHELEGCPRP